MRAGEEDLVYRDGGVAFGSGGGLDLVAVSECLECFAFGARYLGADGFFSEERLVVAREGGGNVLCDAFCVPRFVLRV